MSHRVNHYQEQLLELFATKELPSDKVDELRHIGTEGIPTSDEKLLRIATFIIESIEEVEAQKDFDEWIAPDDVIPAQGWGRGLGPIPQSFFEDVIERTDEAQLDRTFVQGRFEDTL